LIALLTSSAVKAFSVSFIPIPLSIFQSIQAQLTVSGKIPAGGDLA
jgi:hypothetical protein